MPTYYCDFEGGNDANDGLSFANRWKTMTSGATAVRIAPGDTIRLMASPDPTSLGINGTWTSEPQQATSIPTSTTNATPIVVTRASHGFVTGDVIVITGHTTNTGANGTWTVTYLTDNTFSLDGSIGNGVGGATGTMRKINNNIVKLASSLTQTLACTGPRTAWTASANVTATLPTTDFKEHNQSDLITIAAGFTTGLAAYKAIGSTLDLSGYQQVSFWIKQTAGTLATAGQITLRLCSDTAGVTTVDTISVPAIPLLSVWNCFTVDLGANLGSSIQSVALYVATDAGAQNFLINNIIACKASSADDSLNLQSLIGKNDGYWFPIMSIDGTKVMLGQPQAIMPNSALLGGYYGTTETVTTYKRETIKLGGTTGSATIAGTVQDSGTAGNLITFSGGWNRTDMSTQTGKTYWSHTNGSGFCFTASARSHIKLEKVAAVYAGTAFNIGGASASNIQLDDVEAIACAIGLSRAQSGHLKDLMSNVNLISCGTAFTNTSAFGTYSNFTVIGGGIATGSVLLTCNFCKFDGLEIYNVGGPALVCGTTSGSVVKNTINDLVVSGAATNSINLVSIFDTVFNDTILVGGTSSTATAINMAGVSKDVIFYNPTSSGHATTLALAGTAGDVTLVEPDYMGDWGYIVHTTQNAGIKAYLHWPITGTTTTTETLSDGWTAQNWEDRWHCIINSRTVNNPLIIDFADIVVGTGEVTVTLDLFSDDVSNSVSLVCYGGQILGVQNDVKTTVVGIYSPFSPIQITFTPTVAGKVTLSLEAYNSGGSTSFSYKNLVVTQA